MPAGTPPPHAPDRSRPSLADRLLPVLQQYGSALVAFSAGADSALVVAAAARALGAGRVVAATAVSGSLADGELADAEQFARSLQVRHVVVRTNELDLPGYRANSTQRCFFCKSELLEVLQGERRRLGLSVVATGTNADDARSAHRPGIAAAAGLDAVTPLADAGFSKAEVRALSQQWGLPTWDRPAKACLASRVAYGLEVTPVRLARIDRAEHAVRSVLAAADVAVRDLRVRDRGGRATIEVDAAAVAAVEALPAVAAAVRATGFEVVEVDPRGFRSGSLNEPGTAAAVPAAPADADDSAARAPARTLKG